MDHILTEMPNDRAILLDNISCVYCGIKLHKQNRTREHVVGRRFVPKGTLHQNWNLIVQACKSCNNETSDLENDISAITMLPDTLGVYANDDQVLINESNRKSIKALVGIQGSQSQRATQI